MTRRRRDPATDPLTAGIKVRSSHQCKTLGGDGTLGYKIGRHPDGSVHLRISSSDGNGHWNDHWVPVETIAALLRGRGDGRFSSTALAQLYAGMSRNSHAFLAAALRSEGALVPDREGSRVHRVSDLDGWLRRIGASAGKTAGRKAGDAGETTPTAEEENTSGAEGKAVARKRPATKKKTPTRKATAATGSTSRRAPRKTQSK